MSDNSKYGIDGEELNHLLNEAFLDMDFNNPKNNTIMQAISNQVMLTDRYAFTTQNTARRFFGTRGFIIMGMLIIVSVLGTVMFYKINSTHTTGNISALESSGKTAPSKAGQGNAGASDAPVAYSLPDEPVKFQPPQPEQKRMLLPFTSDDTSKIKKPEKVDLKNPEVSKTNVLDSAYVFPVLTEEEIRATEKQKKKMISQLMKRSQRHYFLVPAGTFTYNGRQVSLYPFYIQTMEVTNLEYRTFLYDLLIQNRKEEFLKAKPDQQQWVKETGSNYFRPMAENYFSNPTYDRHPVVNISREGAEMYCKWLTMETNKQLNDKGRVVVNDVRIPAEEEWAYAAMGGNNGLVYPWKTNYVQNKQGCFLANFSFKKFKGTIDTLSGCHKGKFMQALSTGGHMLGEGNFTVWVDSYNPNEYNLYNLSGNAAEMVKNANGQPGTKGGSWNSDPEHLKIEGEDEYAGKTGPSPYIGFRPVISQNPVRVRMK